MRERWSDEPIRGWPFIKANQMYGGVLYIRYFTKKNDQPDRIKRRGSHVKSVQICTVELYEEAEPACVYGQAATKPIAVFTRKTPAHVMI